MAEPVRCAWVGSDPMMIEYHDTQWGRPTRDDRLLFELLMLDCFQAGLSWQIVLRKRESFARAFEGWDPARIARYGEPDVARLLADPGIVRNRLKVAAAITNAQAVLELGSLSDYLWGFVGGKPLVRPAPKTMADIPPRTPESDALSKDLQKRGFRFVGSTIVYAFMQSVGMVNDHVEDCAFRPSA